MWAKTRRSRLVHLRLLLFPSGHSCQQYQRPTSPTTFKCCVRGTWGHILTGNKQIYEPAATTIISIRLTPGRKLRAPQAAVQMVNDSLIIQLTSSQAVGLPLHSVVIVQVVLLDRRPSRHQKRDESQRQNGRIIFSRPRARLVPSNLSRCAGKSNYYLMANTCYAIEQRIDEAPRQGGLYPGGPYPEWDLPYTTGLS